MLHRPWSIVVLTIVLGMSAPVATGFWLFKNQNLSTAFNELNPFMVAFFLSCSIIAIGIWKVRPWGFYSYLVVSCGAVSIMFFNFITSGNTSNYLPLMLATVFAVGTCLLLQSHVSAPYFNPRLRWWERDPRYRVNLGAKFQIDRMTRKGALLDISRGGCFAELDGKLIVGEEIEVRVQMLKFDFMTKARVIWKSDDPSGYGLMFLSMSRRHKKEVDKIINYLMDSQGNKSPIINQGIRPAV